MVLLNRSAWLSICIAFWMLPTVVWATDQQDARAAEVNYKEGLALLSKNQVEAAQDRFQIAIQQYEKLVKNGHANSKLFFNMGNAYYYGGFKGHAVYYYRRAQILNPTEKRIQVALQQARPQEYKLYGVHKLRSYVDGTAWLDRSMQLQLGLAGYFIGWIGLLAGWWFQKKKILMVACPLLLIGLIWLSMSTYVFYEETHSSWGVVTTKTASLREGDGSSYQELDRLPAGTEFVILNRNNNYLHVQLADGTKGWLANKDIISNLE